MLGCIIQQMHHQLVHEIRVKCNLAVGREVGPHAYRHIRPRQVHSLTTIRRHQFGQVHLDKCKRRHSPFEARQIHELFDKIQQFLRALLDVAGHLLHLNGIHRLILLFENHVTIPQNGIQRCAQRLTRIVKKYRLQPLTLLSTINLPLQLLVIIAVNKKESHSETDQ